MSTEDKPQQPELELVIFDTDPGIDDAWAMFMLLKGEQQLKKYKIMAITLVDGNSTLHNVGNNTMRILDMAQRTDIPVFEGAREALIPIAVQKIPPFHGYDGLGDLQYNTQPKRELIQSESAISAMHRIVVDNPKKVTLICIGPLTNVALALRTYPDFGENVKQIFAMGGNYTAFGNSTKCAEYNFYNDPEAAYIVLNSIKCPMTLLPLEACAPSNMFISMDWRFDVLGSIDNDMIKWLNSIDRAIYLPRPRKHWNPYDAVLMAAFLNQKEIIKQSKFCFATVELGGMHTRGQVVIDHLKRTPENVTIIELVNTEVVKNCLLWTANHPNIIL